MRESLLTGVLIPEDTFLGPQKRQPHRPSMLSHNTHTLTSGNVALKSGLRKQFMNRCECVCLSEMHSERNPV